MAILVNIRDALGKDKAEEVLLSYGDSALFRKAALSYINNLKENLLKEIISDDSLINDRSDLRLVKMAELRLIDKFKKILD